MMRRGDRVEPHVFFVLTGEIPFRDRVEGWFTHAASEYEGDQHRREADRVIEGD